MDPWIIANREGLANTLSELERRKVLEEAIQNAMDTRATEIKVSLSAPYRGYSELIVEDNDPEGFVDLKFAYEMFADTPKRGDPTKAGRFTIGEKRILALCKEASIESTTGTIIFEIVNGKDNRRKTNKKRAAGTVATFVVEMMESEYEAAIKAVPSIIPHEGQLLTFNGNVIKQRQPILTFKTTLQTEATSANSRKMSRFKRETEIRLYEPLNGEAASIYELGIPVVDTGDRWHVDVRQRVPLTTDRNNVPPKFLETLRAMVVNQAHELLSRDDASAGWVRLAAGSEKIERDAFEAIETKIHGEKKAIHDPSDPEASKTAAAEGYAVIYGRTMTPDEFKNNKRFNSIQSSSTYYPTPKPYSDDPDAEKTKIVPQSEWTDGMKLVYDYTKALSKKLLNVGLSVRFVEAGNNFRACFGRESGPFNKPQMDWNCTVLGKSFFSEGVSVDVDSLIIHEFGHWFERDHLSKEYYRALTDLGARLKKLALEDPDFFKQFVQESMALAGKK